MMRKLFLIVVLACTTQFVFSQDYTVTGKIQDKVTKEFLEAATIYAQTVKDSTLVSYTISEKKGDFELELQTPEKILNLFISYNGYKPITKKLSLTKSTIDLGTIEMEEQAEQLKGVDLVAEKIPIRVKKDTLEFNADSFSAKPDANLEDALKKLPGFEVDPDGTVKYNGKAISQILVNGKPFFGDDPKIATKNLPKDIIDKIQVTSTKTETEKFTGKEAESDDKTVNITIKKEKNKGYFGRATVGYGTDDKYQVNAIANYFRDKERFSFLAGKNNINNAGFSFDEVYDMIGNRRGGVSFGNNGFSIGDVSFGFGQGITTSTNAGANYTNEYKNKSEISADYFYGSSNSVNETKTSRENLLPDNRYYSNSSSKFTGGSDSHRASATYRFNIDSTFRVSIQPKYSYTKSDSKNISSEETTNLDGSLINKSDVQNNSFGDRNNFSNNLELIKKFGTDGQFVRVNFGNTNVKDEADSRYTSTVVQESGETTNINQNTDTHNKSDSYNVNVMYRRPIVKNLFVDGRYSYNTSKQQNTKNVYDFNDGSNAYDEFNTDLSSDFKFTSRESRPQLRASYEGEKYSFHLGMTYKTTELDNEDYLQNRDFSKKFNNGLVDANMRIKFSQSARLYLDYSADTNVPGLNQLQPIRDISDPLHTYVGNPDLNPEMRHDFRINYNDYDWKNRSGYFLYASASFVNDRIVNNTITDPDTFVRNTTYTNIDGNYNMYGGMNYSKQIKKDSTYTFRFRGNLGANYSHNVSLNNGEQFESRVVGITPGINLEYNYRELIDIDPGYRININRTKFSSDREDVNYINHNVQLRLTTYWPEFLVWGNDITYTYNGNVGANFDKSSVFWNMSLGVKMFKEQGTLKLTAYDLLNQNINTRRITNENYIQDTQSTVLQRYFMLSFTFKFNKFGGKMPNRRGGMRVMHF
ncbi:outer membrane beta-barrel protein [Zhouia sp. PK063]|uniref:outer membrane beta-barrel protein n=1 Tax=Zhouia sp. PK063 TaxID=3373602 RepID=UPI0037A93BD4